MGAIAAQITNVTIVYSTVYWDPDQRKHQNSASLAFVKGIHRGPVNSPHKWPVTRKMFPFDDVIMIELSFQLFGMSQHRCDIIVILLSTFYCLCNKLWKYTQLKKIKQTLFILFCDAEGGICVMASWVCFGWSRCVNI